MSSNRLEIHPESPNKRLEKLFNLQFISADNLQYGVCTDRMSYELYKAVRDENADVKKFLDVLEEVCIDNNIDCSTVLQQATPTGDSLLHVAAEFGKEEIAELLVDHDLLLHAKNFRGQTPLHVAAKAKNIGVMKIILSKFKDQEEKDNFIMLKDKSGKTALHNAIVSKHGKGVKFILREQSEGSLPGYWNTSSTKSPIYLAVQTGDEEILLDLLDIPLPLYQLLFGYQEISPVFAAISERKDDLLAKIVQRREKLIGLVDENRNNPLHYAARVGYVLGVQILIGKSAILAFQMNSNNDLPIHLACQNGHVQVVKELLDIEWSNSMFELNKKGQNILHIAAMSGQKNVVKYLLESPKINSETVNEKDKDGETPLHLAARKSCLWSLLLLSRDKRIDENIVNNKGLTARDVLGKPSEIRKIHHKFIADIILKGAGVPQKANIGCAQHIASTNKDWNVKEEANTLILVAILIATVTFAAGFTIPGGVYTPDEPIPKERGMAILTDQTLFKIFMAFDTLAMYSSIIGCVILLWFPLGDRYFAERVYVLAKIFVNVALITMPVAFLAAIRLVVSNNTLLANVISAIGYVFFFLVLFASGLRKSLLRIRLPFSRQVGDLFIWVILILFYGRNDILIDEDGEIV